ncbi:hypothetical protein ACQR3Q_11465 [Dietzia natronolimnaea]|uniref:hypothetical protein n=1 Tax=Dietzia natronolimnaea TaxID=161920 RepID=UPI003D1081B4
MVRRRRRFDQPADQPIDQPADQPIDQPADQPIDQPTDQPIEKSVSTASAEWKCAERSFR